MALNLMIMVIMIIITIVINTIIKVIIDVIILFVINITRSFFFFYKHLFRRLSGYGIQNHSNCITDCADRHRAFIWFQLLHPTERDDRTPSLTSPTKNPVGSRHQAELWSLEMRNKL